MLILKIIIIKFYEKIILSPKSINIIPPKKSAYLAINFTFLKYIDNNKKPATLVVTDKGISHGSLHLYHDVSRIYKLTEKTIIAFSGDEADF